MRKYNKNEIDTHAKRIIDSCVVAHSSANTVKILNKAWHLAIEEKKRQKKAK